jgi:hypothetical protein
MKFKELFLLSLFGFLLGLQVSMIHSFENAVILVAGTFPFVIMIIIVLNTHSNKSKHYTKKALFINFIIGFIIGIVIGILI